MEKQEQLNPNKALDKKKPADIDDVLASLPEEQREIIIGSMVAMQKSYSGPLPAPEDFAAYEKTLPGATDRILKMAELSLGSRMENEKLIISSKVTQSGRGQILGAVLVSVFGIFSLILGLLGHDWLAGVIAVCDIGFLAVVFVLNKEPKNSPKLPENSVSDEVE